MKKVYDLIVEGYTKKEIENKANLGKNFNEIYKEAKSFFLDYLTDDTNTQKCEMIARYNKLYRDCLKIGNLKGAKDALDSISKINGSMNDAIVKTEFVIDWGK